MERNLNTSKENILKVKEEQILINEKNYKTINNLLSFKLDTKKEERIRIQKENVYFPF